jgi:hypothetical protein
VTTIETELEAICNNSGPFIHWVENNVMVRTLTLYLPGSPMSASLSNLNWSRVAVPGDTASAGSEYISPKHSTGVTPLVVFVDKFTTEKP